MLHIKAKKVSKCVNTFIKLYLHYFENNELIINKKNYYCTANTILLNRINLNFCVLYVCVLYDYC